MHFFFNDTATTEIYSLSLPDALPISPLPLRRLHGPAQPTRRGGGASGTDRVIVQPAESPHGRKLHHRAGRHPERSEEHTSELQSRQYLVCRLLLEKKNTANTPPRRCS